MSYEGKELEGAHCKTKRLDFPLLLDIFPTKKSCSSVPVLITDHILETKVSLVVFRQILRKMACILSHAIITYLKKLNGTKYLKTKQSPAGFSARIMSTYLPS